MQILQLSELRMRARLFFVLTAALAFPSLTSASTDNCRNCYNICCKGDNCWCCQQWLPGNPSDPSNYLHFCSPGDATAPNNNPYCFQTASCGQEHTSEVSSKDVSQQVITEITMAMKSPQRDDTGTRQLGELCLSILNSINPASKVC